MSETDKLLQNNQDYVNRFHEEGLAMPPGLHLAVVACMDARLDVYRLLGLELGQAHVIRNAGGLVSDDALRSLIISQRLLGTREIVLIQHTDCGMLTFTDDQLKQQIRDEVGSAPDFDFGPFDNLDDSVRASIQKVKDCPYLPRRDRVRGFVYDVATGKLREV